MAVGEERAFPAWQPQQGCDPEPATVQEKTRALNQTCMDTLGMHPGGVLLLLPDSESAHLVPKIKLWKEILFRYTKLQKEVDKHQYYMYASMPEHQQGVRPSSSKTMLSQPQNLLFEGSFCHTALNTSPGSSLVQGSHLVVPYGL